MRQYWKKDCFQYKTSFYSLSNVSRVFSPTFTNNTEVTKYLRFTLTIGSSLWSMSSSGRFGISPGGPGGPGAPTEPASPFCPSEPRVPFGPRSPCGPGIPWGPGFPLIPCWPVGPLQTKNTLWKHHQIYVWVVLPFLLWCRRVRRFQDLLYLLSPQALPFGQLDLGLQRGLSLLYVHDVRDVL